MSHRPEVTMVTVTIELEDGSSVSYEISDPTDLIAVVDMFQHGQPDSPFWWEHNAAEPRRFQLMATYTMPALRQRRT